MVSIIAPALALASSIPQTIDISSVTQRQEQPVCARGCLTPIEAVTFADFVAPKAAVVGEFEMPVVAIGEQNGYFYFNSESDYRARNCLTIAMPAVVAEALAGKPGLSALTAAFKDKRIAVKGVAERIRINLTLDGKVSDKYYYQIHVRVGDPKQVTLIRN